MRRTPAPRRRSACTGGRSRSSPSGCPASSWRRGWHPPRAHTRPERGAPTPPHPHPFRACLEELVAVLPPLTLIAAARAGARPLATNLALAAAVAVAVIVLVAWLGSPAQWIVARRRRVRRRLVAPVARPPRPADVRAPHRAPRRCSSRRSASRCWRSSATRVGFWLPPFFIRVHGLDPARAGLVLGASAAAGGWFGTTLGGLGPTGAAARARGPPPRRRRVRPPRGAHRSRHAADRAHDAALALSVPTTAASSLWIGPGRVDGAGPRAAAHAGHGVRGLPPRRDVHRPGARAVHRRTPQRGDAAISAWRSSSRSPPASRGVVLLALAARRVEADARRQADGAK